MSKLKYTDTTNDNMYVRKYEIFFFSEHMTDALNQTLGKDEKHGLAYIELYRI